MKNKLLLSILLVFTLIISGCSLITNNDKGIIDTKYGLSASEVSNDGIVSDSDAATVVSNIVMPATVEISSTIYFNYTYTYVGWGGYGSKTVSDSESCVATGFFINEDGYLMTNAHVVTLSNESNYKDLEYTSRKIQINYADSDEQFDVSLISYDTELDLAILKLDEKIDYLQYVTFFNMTSPDNNKFETEDAVKLYYGEMVIAIGNANGYGISVTTGVVSAPYRKFKENNVSTEAIQTDAAINEGNSGGPLCNKYGAVIGINSFKIVTSTSDNLGFAIPAYVVMNYIEKSCEEKSLEIKYYFTDVRSYTQN